MVIVDGNRHLHKQLYNNKYLPLVLLLTEPMQQKTTLGHKCVSDGAKCVYASY